MKIKYFQGKFYWQIQFLSVSGKKSPDRNKASREEQTPIFFLISSGMFGNISLQRKGSSELRGLRGQKRVKQQVELRPHGRHQHLPLSLSPDLLGEEEYQYRVYRVTNI